MRPDAGNMVSWIGPVSSAGPRSRSSTMILAVRAAASLGRASSACLLQSAKPALARCSRSRYRDWRVTAVTGTLIEFCGLVGTIIVDEDGIYDPRRRNDRLLLGANARRAPWPGGSTAQPEATDHS